MNTRLEELQKKFKHLFQKADSECHAYDVKKHIKCFINECIEHNQPCYIYKTHYGYKVSQWDITGYCSEEYTKTLLFKVSYIKDIVSLCIKKDNEFIEVYNYNTKLNTLETFKKGNWINHLAGAYSYFKEQELIEDINKYTPLEEENDE